MFVFVFVFVFYLSPPIALGPLQVSPSSAHSSAQVFEPANELNVLEALLREHKEKVHTVYLNFVVFSFFE